MTTLQPPASPTAYFDFYSKKWSTMAIEPSPTNPEANYRFGASAIESQGVIMMFGGYEVQQASGQMSSISYFVAGCNSGEFSPDFIQQACQPCPVGTFSGRLEWLGD